MKGLEEYLEDHVKSHLLIPQLPTEMRKQLLFDKRAIFAFFDICTWLCHMGLLSFGKRTEKNKELVKYNIFLSEISRAGMLRVGKMKGQACVVYAVAVKFSYISTY